MRARACSRATADRRDGIASESVNKNRHKKSLPAIRRARRRHRSHPPALPLGSHQKNRAGTAHQSRQRQLDPLSDRTLHRVEPHPSHRLVRWPTLTPNRLAPLEPWRSNLSFDQLRAAPSRRRGSTERAHPQNLFRLFDSSDRRFGRVNRDAACSLREGPADRVALSAARRARSSSRSARGSPRKRPA